MSNVKSIFSNLDEIDLTNDDHELVESCKDFIKESKNLELKELYMYTDRAKKISQQTLFQVFNLRKK